MVGMPEDPVAVLDTHLSMAEATPPPIIQPLPVQAAAAGGGGSEGRLVASPLAWTLAKEKGWNLSDIAISGSGPDMQIITGDVRESIPLAPTAASIPVAVVGVPTGMASATPAASPVQHNRYTDYPLSPTSARFANLLTYSKRTVPHYYLTVDGVLDSLLSLRTRLNTHTNG